MEGCRQWKGRVALVTGASGGIGEGIARALAGIGIKVALAARRPDRLAAIAADLRGARGEVMTCVADVGRETDMLAVFEAIDREWGPLDVLVSNAGTGTMGAVEDGKRDDWRNTLDVNVVGP
jgi:NADP-dependent 3-hydroxy acid dehydrogenase YdfG